MKKFIALFGVGVCAVAGYVYIEQSIESSVKDEIARQFAQVEAQSDIRMSYKNLTVNMWQSSLNLTGVEVATLDGQALLQVDDFALVGYQPNRLPEDVTMTISGIQFTKYAKQLFGDIKADTLLDSHYQFTTHSTLEPQSGNAKITAKLAGNELFDLNMSLGLGQTTDLYQVSLDMQQAARELAVGEQLGLETQLQQQTKMMHAVMAVEPKTFSLSIANRGKLAIALDELAQNQDADLGQLQAVYAKQIALLSIPEQLKQGLTEFVNNLGKLDVSLALPSGTRVMDLQKPDTLSKLSRPEEFADYINLKVDSSH